MRSSQKSSAPEKRARGRAGRAGRASSTKFVTAVSVLFCSFSGLVVLGGCGGGNSSSSQPSPPPQVNSVSVTPTSPTVFTGKSQLFTATVTGTGTYNPAVNWSVNGVAGGNSTVGTITNSGQYTAPSTPPNPNNVMITATSVQTPAISGFATANIFAPTVFVSITPSAASAGETVALNIQNGVDFLWVVFPCVNGTSITLPLTQVSGNDFTIAVPFGATSGNVYVYIVTPQGTNIPVNSLPFTRLPNLRVHAPNKDLSSGETLQLDSRLLGATTPNVVTWTADLGSVSSQGIFQAPVVSSESYAHVTGCLQGTNSCNTVLLRILPFRITPTSPIANVGASVQFGAIQGESSLSPQWSLLAGDGSISTGGLFTAPTVSAQAGAIPISGTVGTTTEQTSVAVSGAFPGLVNRVYDYANFNTYTPPEATFVESVAVSEDRAYTITTGNPYGLAAAYKAIDVYDITNPEQPVWIDAGEFLSSTTDSFAQLFASGNTLFSIDPNYLVSYSLSTQVPTLTAIIPLPSLSNWFFHDGVLYLAESQPYGITTIPVDTYTMNNGTAVHTHYDLPQASTGIGLSGIAAKGNFLYGSFSLGVDGSPPQFTLLTYDISQSPPGLLSTITSASNDGMGAAVDFLYVAGNLLFANSQVYDISNGTPVLVTTIPITLARVWGVEGNSVLATGGSQFWGGSANYVVVDVSSPSNPTVQDNVVDLMTWDVFNPIDATWAGNSLFYAADGTGGIAVYNASVSGGPAAVSVDPVFVYINAQQIQQQTLYVTALYGSGAGGLGCFDLSSGTPNLVGTLTYPNDTSYALQVSGTMVFLGMADSLKVVDASNPRSPIEVTSVSLPVIALALSGNTLFAGTSDGRLVVFDVSTPTSPTQITSVTMPAPSTMRLSGSLLLVAAGQSGLLVFDVSNPTAPVMLSQFSPSVSAPVWDVSPLQGSAVMLAADISGIVTVDLSNPAKPQQLYQQPLPYLNAFPAPTTVSGIIPAFSLATQSGLTYLGTTAGIIFTIDATVPANPRVVGLNVVGEDDLSVVSAITPGTNSLYLAVEGTTIQFDNTVPENSIELYSPPAALSYAIQLTGGDARSSDHGNMRTTMPLSRTDQTAAHDRFGVARHGAMKYFRRQ